MSFLDLYQSDQDQALRPQPNEGHDLPATFGESFQAAWNYGRLFEQSTAAETSRQEALQDYIDDVQQRTGKDPAAGMDWSAMEMGVDGGALPADALDQVNAGVDKINASRSPDQAIPTLDEGDLEQRAVDKSRAAGRALADIAGREHSGLGLFAGGLAAAATDPINMLALPAAPETESVSLLAAALRFGGVAAASQAAIEGIGAPYREQVQPGYLESGAPIENVLEAGGSGALLGGATRFLGNAWTRFKTGSWPTSVKDAGNVVESEANVANSNVYAGAEGEAAHRDALAASIDQIMKEQPVDVSHIITPDIEAGSRDLISRMETQAPALPIFDQRAIQLISEEAGLRSRNGEISQALAELPEGDAAAADRLNRLQAVEQQLQTATGTEAKRLSARRDQILVDTTPEQLQAAAAPFERRRVLEAEQTQIGTRLDEIAQERARTRAEALGAPEVMIGQRQPIRPVPLEDLRQVAANTESIAGHERAAASGEPAPELPFGRPSHQVELQLPKEGERTGLIKVGDGAGTAGFEVKPDAVHIGMVSVSKSKRGQGLAVAMYERAVQYADSLGLPLRSDIAVSQDAARVYDALQRRGYQVTKEPNAVFHKKSGSFSAADSKSGYVFEVRPPVAAEVEARQSADALTDGMRQIATRAGYEMPQEEAAQIAAKLMRMSPEDAQGALRTLQTSPRQAAEGIDRPAPFPASASPAVPDAEGLKSTLAAPDYGKALQGDIDRERAMSDLTIPVDVDKNGEPIRRSIDDLMGEADALQKASEQIAACAAPAAEEGA